MSKAYAKKYFNTLWPVELYKLTSFLSSVILWLALYFTQDDFILNSHFVSMLVMGNAYFYFQTKSFPFLTKDGPYQPLYFVFQFVCFLGLSYTYNNEYIYMSLLPCIMMIYYSTFVADSMQSIKEKKSLIMYALSFAGVLIFESYKKGNIFSKNEFIVFLVFCFWSFSMAYWGVDFYIQDKKRVISRLLSLGSEERLSSSRVDKMFFHDLINHTHALLLFLRSKRNENIAGEDIHTLIGELKLLQDNIQNHFGFDHKNLNGQASQVPFQIALARVYSLVDAFFPGMDNVFFTFRGKLSNQEDTELLRSCSVNLVVFHRIMTNIFKNASEAHSNKIECIFDYNDHGLVTTVINSVSGLNYEKISLDKDLGRVISSIDHKNQQGIGLDSISKMCEDIGGTFNFSYANGCFYSEFYLPGSNVDKKSFVGNRAA